MSFKYRVVNIPHGPVLKNKIEYTREILVGLDGKKVEGNIMIGGPHLMTAMQYQNYACDIANGLAASSEGLNMSGNYASSNTYAINGRISSPKEFKGCNRCGWKKYK